MSTNSILPIECEGVESAISRTARAEKRAVLVESDQASAIKTVDLLKSWGIAVSIFPDFSKATSFLRKRPSSVDFIICEIKKVGSEELMFPFLTKSKKRLEEIPIICISSVSDKEKVVQLIKSGYAGLLLRPFNDEDLKSRLQSLSIQRKALM